MHDKKEQFLLFRIRGAKDADAFTEIFNVHKAYVLRYLSLKLPTPQDADDALSATFLRLWNYLTSGVEVEHLRALIQTIARAVVAEFYQKRRDVSMDPELLPEPSVSGESIVLSADVRLVREALNRLDRKYRRVLVLRYFEDLSVSEVAKRTRKSYAATATLISRAAKEFRKQFPYYDDRS